MHIRLSANYVRSLKKFVKDSGNNSEKAKKAITLFRNNPQYPSLKIEKLKGSRVWTIRIDKGNRIFFYWVDEETALFIDIGKHDKYRRY